MKETTDRSCAQNKTELGGNVSGDQPHAGGTAVELFHQDGRTAGIFYCSHCRAVHASQDAAQRCHGRRKCDGCAEILSGQPYYRKLCEACDRKEWQARRDTEELARYEKAAKIPAADWKGTQVFWDDRYFECPEEAIEHAESSGVEVPDYIWAAQNIGVRSVSTEDLTERIIEEMWEDAEESDLNGLDELEAAIEAFNEANKSILVWMVDHSTAIILASPEAQ